MPGFESRVLPTSPSVPRVLASPFPAMSMFSACCCASTVDSAQVSQSMKGEGEPGADELSKLELLPENEPGLSTGPLYTEGEPEPAPMEPEAQPEETPKEEPEWQEAQGWTNGWDFQLELEKGNERKWGLVLDPWLFGTQAVQVISVSMGSVAEHNATTPVEKQLLPGDLIVGVNGFTDAKQMVSEVRRAEKLSLLVCRPTQFRAKMETGGQPLGVTLSYQKKTPLTGTLPAAPQSACVRIKDVLEEGVFKAYNDDPGRDGFEVKKCDFIQVVNGISGSAVSILDAMKKAETLDMVLLRLPQAD